MKKKIILLGILILLKIILPIKPYIELNNLKIIKEIKISCEKDYKIEYIEVLPEKEENGIQYKYKKYQVTAKTLEEGIQKIEKNKKIYKEKAKVIIECNKREEIKKRGLTSFFVFLII